MTVTVIRGDALSLPLPGGSADAIVTDPPYGLGFMGHEWDQPGGHAPVDLPARRVDGGQWGRPSRSGPAGRGSVVVGSYDHSQPANARFGAWCTAWGAEALRVAKPGAHLVCFGGPRTFHRLTVGLKDAGWEIRDVLCWLFGQGFPKSLDVSKALDRSAGHWRGRAGEIESPNKAMGGGNHQRTPKGAPITAAAAAAVGLGTALKPGWEPIVLARKPLIGTVAANVAAHGTGALNIDATRIPAGETWDGGGPTRPRTNGIGSSSSSPSSPLGRWPANVVFGEAAAAQLDAQTGGHMSGATTRGGIGFRGGALGGEVGPAGVGASVAASRFYYVAKASGADRGAGNTHPTVKPVDLMRWLIRLVTPRDRLVLDQFAGSGTTGVAAETEGRHAILVERDPGYVELIRDRLSRPLEPVLDLREATG